MEIKEVAVLLNEVFEIGLDFTLITHLGADQPHSTGSTATPGDWLPYRPVWL